MREHESQLKRMISEVGGQTKQGLTGVKTFQDCVRVDETVHVRSLYAHGKVETRARVDKSSNSLRAHKQ